MPGDRPPSSPSPDERGEDPPARPDGDDGSGGAAAWPGAEATGAWAPARSESPPGPPVPRTYPSLRPSPTFDTWRRWPSPPSDGGGSGPAEPQGNPWLVALAVGLATIVIVLVAVGLKVAAGTDPITPTLRGSRVSNPEEQAAREEIAKRCRYPAPVSLTLRFYEAVQDPSISDHWTFSVATANGYVHDASVFKRTNGGGYIVGCYD